MISERQIIAAMTAIIEELANSETLSDEMIEHVNVLKRYLDLKNNFMPDVNDKRKKRKKMFH